MRRNLAVSLSLSLQISKTYSPLLRLQRLQRVWTCTPFEIACGRSSPALLSQAKESRYTKISVMHKHSTFHTVDTSTFQKNICTVISAQFDLFRMAWIGCARMSRQRRNRSLSHPGTAWKSKHCGICGIFTSWTRLSRNDLCIVGSWGCLGQDPLTSLTLVNIHHHCTADSLPQSSWNIWSTVTLPLSLKTNQCT